MKRSGFALITTLVILALLAVIIVSFLSSMSSDRAAAHAYSNVTQADLSMRAAVEEATATLKQQFETYPDSSTAWLDVSGNAGTGDAVTGGTYLFYWEHSNDTTTALDYSPSPVPHFIYFRPLTSGSANVRTVVPNSTVSGDWSPSVGDFNLVNPAKDFADSENSFDLNHARFPNDNSGWIGAAPGTKRRAFRAPWVEMKDTSDPAKPMVIGRYAYWVEDESFRVNANCATATPRGSDDVGASAASVPIQGLFSNGLTNASGEGDTVATQIVNSKASLPNARFLEFRALNQVNAGLADAYRFEGTVFSGALNLSRGGVLRLDLNAVVQENPDAPADATADTIRTRLDEMISAIKQQLPNFGQRFYRLDDDLNKDEVSSLHQDAYFQKIAANIHDYIDADLNPTIVMNDPANNYPVLLGKQTQGVAPLSGTSGPINWIAIGKEAVPYLQEFAVRATLHKLDPATFDAASATPDEGIESGKSPNSPAWFDFDLDYYFEFWNMTTKDITYDMLGPHPVIRVYNQPGFLTSSGLRTGTVIDPDRPFEIAINPATGGTTSDVVFPAGSVTVVTTDTNPSPRLLQPGTSVVTGSCVATARHFEGWTYHNAQADQTDPDGKSRYGYRVDLNARSASGRSDYETAMLLESDDAVLESFCSLPIARSAGAAGSSLRLNNDFYLSNPTLDNDRYFIRGGSLQGNSSSTSGQAITGDPRTNNEQLSIYRYTGGSATTSEETRYLNSLDDNDVPGSSTIGAPNSNFVDPGQWVDYSSSGGGGAVSAPMVIADGVMQSIGELGNIFDPARPLGPSGDIERSRGGGRTLKIGQPDALWDKDPTSRSHEWAAWRLGDIFCTGSSVQLEGNINVNGVLRDNGAALKAALYGFRFAAGANSDAAIAQQPIDQSTADALVEQIIDRLKGDSRRAGPSGPLFERGELSELPLFAPAAGQINGVDTRTVNDRGREELFRRLVELTTTKGNVFSIYAVGQSIKQGPDGRKVITASSQSKVTIRLIPRWNAYGNGTPPATFDPSDSDAKQKRFAKPDRYDVQVLQVSQ